MFAENLIVEVALASQKPGNQNKVTAYKAIISKWGNAAKVLVKKTILNDRGVAFSDNDCEIELHKLNRKANGIYLANAKIKRMRKRIEKIAVNKTSHSLKVDFDDGESRANPEYVDINGISGEQYRKMLQIHNDPEFAPEINATFEFLATKWGEARAIRELNAEKQFKKELRAQKKRQEQDKKAAKIQQTVASNRRRRAQVKAFEESLSQKAEQERAECQARLEKVHQQRVRKQLADKARYQAKKQNQKLIGVHNG